MMGETITISISDINAGTFSCITITGPYDITYVTPDTPITLTN